MKDIFNLTKRFCFLVIDLEPAKKNLPDGRNAHILLEKPEWWSRLVNSYFSSLISSTISDKNGIARKVIVTASNNQVDAQYMYKFNLDLKVPVLKFPS